MLCLGFAATNLSLVGPSSLAASSSSRVISSLVIVKGFVMAALMDRIAFSQFSLRDLAFCSRVLNLAKLLAILKRCSSLSLRLDNLGSLNYSSVVLL